MKKIVIALLIIIFILGLGGGYYAYSYYNLKPKKPDYSCNLEVVLGIVNKSYSTGNDYIYFTVAKVNGDDDKGIIKLNKNDYDYLEVGGWYVFNFKVNSHIKDKYKDFKYPVYSIRDIVDNYNSLSITSFSDNINPMIDHICK